MPIGVEVCCRVELCVVGPNETNHEPFVGEINIAVEVNITQSAPINSGGEQARRSLDVGVSGLFKCYNRGDVVAICQSCEPVNELIAINLTSAALSSTSHRENLRVG